MIKKVFFIMILFFTGSGFSQYLTYSELIGLLNIAHDNVKVDEYLLKRGFEYFPVKSTDSGKYPAYRKLVGEIEYKVAFFQVKSNGKVALAETCVDISRWKYFKQIVSTNGFKQSDTRSEDGFLGIQYENKEYSLALARFNTNGTNTYLVAISKL